MKYPDFSRELELWNKGFSVIGIDEVGRGAFAGPLVLGAVSFAPQTKAERKELETLGINDSKKLSARQREKLVKEIKTRAACYATSFIPVNVINRQGITKAEEIGIRKVVSNIVLNLKQRSPFLLIDAFYCKYIKGVGLRNQLGIIHGDELSISIAAASIIAKVERDNLMKEISSKYPVYKLDSNKGYGTLAHREALKQYGASKLHRTLWVSNFV